MLHNCIPGRKHEAQHNKRYHHPQQYVRIGKSASLSMCTCIYTPSMKCCIHYIMSVHQIRQRCPGRTTLLVFACTVSTGHVHSTHIICTSRGIMNVHSHVMRASSSLWCISVRVHTSRHEIHAQTQRMPHMHASIMSVRQHA